MSNERRRYLKAAVYTSAAWCLGGLSACQPDSSAETDARRAVSLPKAATSTSRGIGMLLDLANWGLVDTWGKPVPKNSLPAGPCLINFWALWCEPCRREMPALARLASDWSGKGVEVLGVALSDKPLAVSEFMRLHAPDFRGVLLAPGAPQVIEWQISALPDTLLVDAGGRVLRRWLGAQEWDDDSVRADILKSLAIGTDS